MTGRSELNSLVRDGLIKADASTEGTPDYDQLAEVAVTIVFEQIALHAFPEFKERLMEKLSSF